MFTKIQRRIDGPKEGLNRGNYLMPEKVRLYTGMILNHPGLSIRQSALHAQSSPETMLSRCLLPTKAIDVTSRCHHQI